MKTQAILRSDDEGAAAVKPLDLDGDIGLTTGGPAGHAEPETHPLEAEIKRLQETLRATEEKHGRNLVEAREKGRDDALAGFKRDQTSALAMLEKGIAAAVAAFGIQIELLESLSLSMCDITLSKVLGDPARRSELIAGAISEQVAIVRNHAVVGVRVSSGDFPDPQSLLQLAHRAGLANDAVQTAPGMHAGECEIVMRLGQIDLSIPDYLAQVRGALADAASKGQVAS